MLSRILVLLALSLAACAAQAEGSLFKVHTRDGVVTTLFWETAPDAKATVFLFPGGGGGFGKVEEGKPTSNNFLVRSALYFTANGFNVAIFGRPSDSEDLDYADRINDTHMADVRKVLDFVKTQSAAPVWIVGTSRSTISATATAVHALGDIAGLVLTSSVVNYKKPGAVPKQDLAAIKVPVLMLHHSKDACIHCRPDEVPGAFKGFRNAPVKKLIFVDGGANPTGDASAGLHHHGFIGMEREAVDTIAGWIKLPTD